MQGKIDIDVIQLEDAAAHIKNSAETIGYQQRKLNRQVASLENAWQSEAGTLYRETLKKSVVQFNRQSEKIQRLSEEMLKTAKELKSNENHLQKMFQINQ